MKGFSRLKYGCVKKFVCFFVCAAMLATALCCPSAAERQGACFYLEAVYHPEYEMVTVELVCGGGEIAGAMLEIEYDSCFSFTSAESSVDGLEFTCSLNDIGKVRVLFDSSRNVDCKGSMALLGFALSKEARGSFAFGLRCLDAEDIYGVEGCEFYTVEADMFGCFVNIPMAKSSRSAEYLGFYSETLEDGNTKLSLVATGGSESVGIELCAVDPMNGTVKTSFLDPIRKCADDEGVTCFIFEYLLPRDSLMLCLFVKTLDGGGETMLCGEEYVHFFYKGAYTEYDDELDQELHGCEVP